MNAKLFACVGLLCWMVVGCSHMKIPTALVPGVQSGTFTFRLSKANVPANVTVIVANLERSGYAPRQDSLFVAEFGGDTLSIQMNEIPSGNWFLTVTAKDSLGIDKYVGNSWVTILAGQTVEVAVVMNPAATGTGNLLITVIWPETGSRWEMATDNPVISPGSNGFDADYVWFQKPWILKNGSTYRMWYHTGIGPYQWIAYATSSDGNNWTKQGIVLPQGTSESWYSAGTSCPSVLYEDGEYKMWFNGKTITNPHHGIGYATSSNGVDWTESPTQVIPCTPQKPAVFGACVIKRIGVYYLYYSVETNIGGFSKDYIYLATSDDAASWNDMGLVFPPSQNRPWESNGVCTPFVVDNNGVLEMYYTASRRWQFFSRESALFGRA
jgi:predicted GH43/DUF377 family glycosyl hydrolase